MTGLFPGFAAGIAVGFILGIPLHHVAHARVATMLGDKSARFSGRNSLSIKRHLDALGTVIVPAVWTIVWFFGEFFTPVFGWGKPQPINTHLLSKRKRDTILIALAGPAATVVLAAAAGVALRAIEAETPRQILVGIVLVAVFMTVFELLPLPGRDGGRILGAFLSFPAQQKMYELAQYEVLFIVGIYIFSPLRNTVSKMGFYLCDLVASRCSG